MRTRGDRLTRERALRDFAGKVAVVTGAANGIGRAFAVRFATEGMKVVLADVEAPALDVAVQELTARELDVVGVLTDVASAESVRNSRGRPWTPTEPYTSSAATRACWPHRDTGSTGAADTPTPLWEQSLQDWQWTFGVNLWGVVHGIRSFIPIMLAQDEPGHVVNTASAVGLTSGAALAIYSTTKHAVVRISEALYLQLAQLDSRVGVSVLCPGSVDTRLFVADRNRPDKLSDEGSWLTPEELVQREREWAESGDAGIPPGQVAERVLEAIREQQFYILTHDEYDDEIRRRTENILARRNPEPGRL